MQARLMALFKNSFLRDVVKLSLGTIFGRLIALVALPLVTRLYAPEDFVLLAVYLALVSTLAVAAGLRLDVAIPLADSDDEAANLLTLALAAAGVVALIVLGALRIAPEAIAERLGSPELVPFLWLVPLGIFLAASYSALQFWATRARRFGLIAQTRVTQAAFGVVAMLGLGWVGFAPLGLLLGNMFNLGAGGVRLGFYAVLRDSDLLSRVTWHSVFTTLRKNRRYPLLSTPEALANVAGIQIPILLIAFNGGAEAGFLLLAMQVMASPMTLLGRSISQVFVSRAPEALREGRLAEFTLSIMWRLVLLGMGPLIVVGAIAPTVFPLVFGAEWQRAGIIVSMLVPWMVLQFIASPVSMVMYMTGRQRAMLMLTLVGAAMRITAVWLAVTSGGVMVGAMATTSAFFYAVCIVVFAKSAGLGSGKPERKLLVTVAVVLVAYFVGILSLADQT